MEYIVAIPTYHRSDIIEKKTLTTLKHGNVDKNRIYIFVANAQEKQKYERVVSKEFYNQIIVGKKGIGNQRKFISQYFPEGQYIVSIDDDVEAIEKLNGEKLQKIHNLDNLFNRAFSLLNKEKLYIWGIYPVRNAFFMKHQTTTDLRFIIGIMYGFVNRHHPKLYAKVPVKEDYEMSILYYLMDGGVVRINDICAKQKFMAPGGVGSEDDRRQANKAAAEYLAKKYPELVTEFERPTNGMAEVRLSKMDRFYPKV